MFSLLWSALSILLLINSVAFGETTDQPQNLDSKEARLRTNIDDFYYNKGGYIKSSNPDVTKFKVSQIEESWDGEIIQLSWHPRASLYKGFLSKEECEHIVSEGKNRLIKSSVVDQDTGGSVPSEVRTSSGTWFNYDYDEVITRVENRIAFVTMAPKENQEPMQLLHYIDGQKYEAHWDYFMDTENPKPKYGGQRYLTVLMYLTNVQKGGETTFPRAEEIYHKAHATYSECGNQGLSVKPEQGDALIFYSLTPSGQLDTQSLHQSCPVLEGDKYTATKWIRQGKYNQAGGPNPAGDNKNNNPQ